MLSKDQTLGKYQILDRLGSGGFGAVYLAMDTWVNRKVAPVSMRLMSRGERVISAMSHFSPTLCTQVPTFDAMAAIQMARKRWLRSGANGDLALVTGSGYPDY